MTTLRCCQRRLLAFNRIIKNAAAPLSVIRLLLFVLLATFQCQSTFAFSDRFQFQIQENSPESTLVGQIVTRPGFTYRFKDDIAEFELDSKTGIIRTTDVPTDRETRADYSLVILSSTPTYPVEVRIRVLDLNDNTPFWPVDINTNISFSESAPVGTKVMLDSAVDLDSGPLNYSLVLAESNTIQGKLPFKLVYNTSTSFLHLEVVRKLDRELQAMYLLNISAIDQDAQLASAIFSVRIVDSNDNPPIFDQSDYSVSLNESMPVGVSILQVRASDADEEENENSRIAYFMNSDDFQIDSETGVISTAHSGSIRCGRSAAPGDQFWRVCVFTVFAHDFGTPRQDGRTYITAKIHDSNNHAPAIKFRYFSKTSFASIDESASNGSIVAAVSVVDFDQGPNGKTSVELLPVGNDLKHFRLDSMGGSHIIRVNGQLDREKIQLYNLTVLARDHGTPSRSSTAVLSIFVQDHNDHAPQFEREVYEVAVQESDRIGELVAAPKARDDDEGINAQIYYSLSGQNSHFFRIDHQNGLITTDKSIDRESHQSFELKITARDSGSQPKWAHSIFRVTVLDANDNTPKVEVQGGTNHEVLNNDDSRLDVSVTVQDSDLGDNGTVDMALVYDFDGLFRISTRPDNTENGASSAIQQFRLESTRALSREQYKLVLEARDRAPSGHQLRSLTTVHVRRQLKLDSALPALQPMKYLALIPLDIDDHSARHAQLLPSSSIEFVDQNNARHRLSLRPLSAPGSNDQLEVSQLFTLDSAGQSLTANDRSKLSHGQSFDFEVHCEGCETEANNVHLTVLCLDRVTFDSPPRHVMFNISEDASSGTAVGEMSLSSGALQQQRHFMASTANLEQHFRVSVNQQQQLKVISLTSDLDRETVSDYGLKIVSIATDSRRVEKLFVNIHLDDIQDSPTHFPVPYDVVDITDEMPAGTVVYELDAQDGDVGAIRYELAENPNDLLEIRESNQLQLARSLASLRRHSPSIMESGNVHSRDRLLLKVTVTAVQLIGGAASISSNVTSSHQAMAMLYTAKGAASKKRQTGMQTPSDVPTFTLYLNLYFGPGPSPVFAKKFTEFRLSESTIVTERFGRIEARNLRPESGFAIVAGNHNDSFGILPTGQLYVNRRLDRETIEIFRLQVAIVERRNITLDVCEVILRITDANDNRPRFEVPVYDFQVPENEDKNFFIGRVQASDADSGLNSRVVYSIVKSYYSSFIQIDAHSGYLWTTQPYDRESLGSFEITVQATDQPVDEKALQGITNVRIQVLDVNDNSPVFEIPSNVTFISKNRDRITGSISVSEATPEDSVLANFHAIDADLNTTLSYDLISNGFDGQFSLNSTGSLVLVRKLDREARQEYSLEIVASDGEHRAVFELKLTVDDVDDCEPMWLNFTQEELRIPENASIGSEILAFDAVDADVGANALFHFELEQSAGQKVFDILTNKLVLVNHLDYEKARSYKLNISLVESNSHRVVSTRSVVIVVEDINDCRPSFTQRTETEVVRIPENVDIGTKLLTLQATDCDVNDVLTFEILSCSTHYHTHKNIYQKEHELQHKHDSNNCPLKLNTRTGEIININALDREVIESINLHLSVRDSVGHTDRMKVIVIIEDINDESPMFVSPKNILVDRELARRGGALLGAVKAMDLDMGINSAITYKLQPTEEDFSSLIELDKQSGVIRLRQPIDYLLEHAPITLNVSATDGGGLATFDIVELIMKPSLQFLEPEQISLDIYENEAIGSKVTELKCHDSSNQCQYYLINATDRNFGVDPLSGVISTVDLVDREMLAIRFLDILRIGQKNLQRVLVRINVLDENDNPPYLTNTSIVVHLSESLYTGVEVFSVASLIADEDISNKFDYQIINCSACDSTFGLARKTGALTLLRPLDAESVSKYRILFGVSDGIYLLTSLMEIVVDDENDNKPYFNQSTYVFEIPENTDRGTLVGTVIAFDEDVSSNKNLVYSYAEDQEIPSAFSLDSRSGQFTLSKKLDYETDPSHYVFWIEASDGKYKSQPVKVVFALINLPDNAPRFEFLNYKLEVSENRVIENILCVKAIDEDLIEKPEQNDIDVQLNTSNKNSASNIQLKYTIEAANSAEESFEIDSKSGCISVVKSLDRESVSHLELNVKVDDGHSNASTIITVTVLDENDNYPEFDFNTVRVLKIQENLKLDSVFYTFKATDRDEAPNNYVKYELLNSSEPVPFILGPIDGQLKVTGLIDAESNDVYDLVIRASDFGLKHTDWNIKILVEDMIDNVPKFPRDKIVVNVFENASIGEVVYRLHAIDLDRTDEVNYKIISETQSGFFSIEDDCVVVASRLNFEETSTFDLKIHAIDRVGNLDTLNLKVQILNVFDERPMFLDSPYRVNWFENRVGFVDRFEAVSEDETHKALSNVNYLLLNNYDNAFRINSTTGTLSIMKEIDRELLVTSVPDAVIELKLLAIDTRSRLSSEGIVLVKIIDRNDNAPQFEFSAYQFELQSTELLDVNHTIGRVNARDIDRDDNIQFYLDNTFNGLFFVDSRGRIRIGRPSLGRETQQSVFEFQVIASDGIHNASVSVKIISGLLMECSPRLLKVNNVPVNQQQNSVKISLTNQELQSLVEKRFPILGFQVQKCPNQDESVHFRMSSESFFELDSESALIKLDPKTLNLVQSEHFHSFQLIVSQRLSKTYTIGIQTTLSKSIREDTLVPQNRVHLKISEFTKVGQQLFDFESLKNSEVNIFAGDLMSQFEVKQGHLLLAKSLDYEMIKSYDLFVRIKSGQVFEFASIHIEVLNENDNAPRFDQEVYNVTILEEEDRLDNVFQVRAHDADDENAKIVYTLKNQNVPFKLDSVTGKLSTTAKIDREMNSTFTLIVDARGEQNKSSECKVVVTIEDKNDNPPRFTRLFRANITENIRVGSFVIQVKSHDRDSANFSNVNYQMLTKTEDFRLDSRTGNLFVASELDREKQSKYFLTISADDGSWKSQTTVTIHVLDENDNSPIFDRDFYLFEAQLPEEAFDERIGQVNATDLDDGPNGSVFYRLKHKSQNFAVNTQTGVISIKRMPKVFEDEKLAFMNQHFLTVIASDKGLVPRLIETLVQVNLKTKTDFASIVEIQIPQDLKNNSVVFTSNSLLDLIDHHEKIVSTQNNHLRFVSEGSIKKGEQFAVDVDVQFGVRMLNITVVDANQFAPEFEIDSNSTNINENILPLDKVVKRFTAIDSDASSFNNLVRYSMNLSSIQWNPNVESYLFTYQDKYPELFKKNLSILELVGNIEELTSLLNPFQMDSITGQLSLINALDFEVITKYSLLIQADDNAWYSKNTILFYEIIVVDLDDYIDYNLIDSSSLYNASAKPDPMSIGVFVVVFFFVVLILVISTSFVFYHNQRKGHHRNESTRKIFHSLNPYLTTNSTMSQIPPNSRLPVRFPHTHSRQQLHPGQPQSILSIPQNMPIRHQPPTQPAPQPPGIIQQQQQLSHHPSHSSFVHQLPQHKTSTVANSTVQMNSIRLPPVPQHQMMQHSPVESNSYRNSSRPDIVSPPESVLNGSESASVVASRIRMKAGPSSIYTQNSNENYADNYSNIMAGAEHYDLENASNIAPSDIDIVYHYKGYRQHPSMMIHAEKERGHAPLARLSPSVSELSAAPRILTLQDLSPHIPPPPPIRPHHRKTHSQLESVSQENLDQVAETENSYSVSEYAAANYEICGNQSSKDTFQRVW